MNKLITLITPTGGREEAFALCQKYMLRQTVPNLIQWIIVTDVEEPVSFTEELQKDHRFHFIETYRGSKLWRPGINTQRPNLDEAIKHVKGDFIFIIEDDDWYSPMYLETQLFFLQKFDIVGEANSHYYNIKERKYKNWGNYNHTSLNQTALKASKLDLLDRAINSGQLFFDMALWEIVKKERHSFLLYSYLGLVVGMKGLPGKVGIGGGHAPDDTFTRDPRYDVLREWIGVEDMKVYVDMIMRQHALHPS